MHPMHKTATNLTDNSVSDEHAVDDLQGTHHHDAHAFPTDAKEKEKEKRRVEKEHGIEHKPRKRQKTVETHHDDCGTDMTSLDVDTEDLVLQVERDIDNMSEAEHDVDFN